MIEIFNTILVRPLFNLLVVLYNFLPGHDFGVAIILLTVIVRLVLYPIAQKGIKAQKAQKDLQPQISALQKKYKDKKEKQAQELIKLYRENKVNPASGCLPLLIQLPVLIALFQVLRLGINPETLGFLYSFVAVPENINSSFLGLVDLGATSLWLGLLAGITQFVQGKMILPDTSKAQKGDFAGAMNKQMIYAMPVITVLVAARFPAGLALYWTVSNLFTILQQYLIIRKKEKNEEKGNPGNN